MPQEVPAREVPAQEVPTQEVATQEVPMQEVAAREVAARQVPAQEVAMHQGHRHGGSLSASSAPHARLLSLPPSLLRSPAGSPVAPGSSHRWAPPGPGQPDPGAHHQCLPSPWTGLTHILLDAGMPVRQENLPRFLFRPHVGCGSQGLIISVT